MFGIGMTEIVVILVIALLIFGPNKLPELARSLGRGFGEFRRASYDLRQALVDADVEPSRPRPRPPERTEAPERPPVVPSGDDAPREEASADAGPDAPPDVSRKETGSGGAPAGRRPEPGDEPPPGSA